MEKNRLIKAIAGSMFIVHNIKQIKSVRDIYKDITSCNIENMQVDATNEDKVVFEWILEHPEYDFNSLYNTGYTNQELNVYFKVYYDNILYILDRYNRKDYIIKPTDFA